MPQSAGDDIHRNIVGDHSTAAGHGGLFGIQRVIFDLMYDFYISIALNFAHKYIHTITMQ